MLKYRFIVAVALSCAMACASAQAVVVVTVDGNVAHADISLDNGIGATYSAEVTITFDSTLNLDADSLNLTAQLVDPHDSALTARLPGCTLLVDPPNCMFVDPAFPMLITVEPPDSGWLFKSGFDNAESGTGDLSFLNTYEFEIHTHDLVYTQNSPYRLFKAPIGGLFGDVTDDVLSGSVRTRGRGGAFSQFLIVSDTRLTMTVALGKIVALDTRILAASLSNLLRGDLLGLLNQVNVLVLVDVGAAIEALDSLIAEINLHAGLDIANVWRSEHDVVNDAGEMLSLAQTLRFSLVRLQGSATPP
ncbi:MAG: DUF6689 family protein [Dokdonella sp.]